MNRSKLLVLLILSIMVLSSGVFASCDTHDAEAYLSPEWSSPGNTEYYSVEIENTGCYDITEVRVYKNDKYSNFTCEEKDGWNLVYMNTNQYEACFYYANDSSDYITPGNGETFHFSATTPDNPECNLRWKFEARDTENWWNYLYDSTSVDETAPTIEKTVGLPQKEKNGELWVTQDTQITLTVYDTGECGVSELDYCEMRVLLDGDVQKDWYVINWQSIVDINGTDYYTYTFDFDKDSQHTIEVRCYDNAGNEADLEETDRVDSASPETVLHITEPKYDAGDGVLYVDTVTNLTLSAEDPDPTGKGCNIGVMNTFYATQYTQDYRLCNTPQSYCNSEYIDFSASDWSVYDGGNIPKEQEGCLVIGYYSVDELGNVEHNKYKCIFVDKSKPEVYINVPVDAKRDSGEEDFITDDNPEGDFYWVTSNDEIKLSCADQGVIKSHQEKLCINVNYDGSDVTESNYCSLFGGTMNDEGYCCKVVGLTPYYFAFNENEDSKHILSAYCEDAVNKRSSTKVEYFKVDNTPPTINKTMFGTYLGNCPPQNDSDICYLKGGNDNGIHVEVTDGGDVCHSDHISCTWYYHWNGSDSERIREDNVFDISFNEDSKHDLTIVCSDWLGNTVTDKETFYVDMLPPETILRVGIPSVEKNDALYINSDTLLTISASDEKSGVNKTYYRVMLSNNPEVCMNYYCEPESYESYVDMNTEWNIYDHSFNINEDSCHVIEYYSVDNLGNEEMLNSRCIYVDNQAPEMSEEIGSPKVEKNNVTYITTDTKIRLSCKDKDPHPVKEEQVYYKYRVSEDCENWGNWTEWFAPYMSQNNDGGYDAEITFPEESCHEIEYYCKDELGNENEHVNEVNIVDITAPNITKSLEGEWYGNCTPQNSEDRCYVSTETNITVNSVDQDPHPVGFSYCKWYYKVIEYPAGAKGYSEEVPFKIRFNEDSHHVLTIKCYDELGNSYEDKETFIVDANKPLIYKEYEGPYFTDGISEWISSDTKIHLSTEDQEPHPSGVREFKYRISLVDDEYCYNPEDMCDLAEGSGNWTIVNGTETITHVPEESCHLIEAVSTDNVGNKEIHKQCVFVDNSEPLPNKTVGLPKTKWTWDAFGDEFYNVSGKCWNGGNDSIDCWKITLMTPIDLNCVDQDPHPVDHESVCFQVGLDGDDSTETYCDLYRGVYDNETGFCCMNHKIEQFYFDEVSYHKLSYYCIDALGNQGPVDTEMFKVEETAFRIQLNKKWNLISVPVKLLDNAMDEVFKGIENEVASVWTYNGTDWFVYTPDNNPDNDNLNTMSPGWGYWILAKNDTSLTIGGSLMSPAMVPPERTIVKGWNLIGYYGADGLYTYNGPAGMGKRAMCALNSLGESIWDKSATSIWTYWEPYNPESWIELERSDKMDPGAGYWVYSPTGGTYAPSTTCSWV